MTLEEVYQRLLTTLKDTQTPFASSARSGSIAWGRPRATTDLDLVIT